MDDANLAKLVVKPGEYTPIFHKDTTEYQMIVSSDVDKLEIEATTSDRGASYNIKYKEKDGNKCILKDGLNKIPIEVSSEDGTTKLYNINCQRLSASDAFLKSLTVSDVVLQPSFDCKVFDYSSVVPYHAVNCKIDAQVEDKKCEIKFKTINSEPIKNDNNSFNLDFNFGFTEFQIHVKSPNGQNTSVYKVVIKKQINARFARFKNQLDSLLYEDPISLAPLYCPIKTNGNESSYSLPFGEVFYSMNKQDLLTGNYIKSDNNNEWKVIKYDIDTSLSKCEVAIPQINGETSDVKPLREIGQLIDNVNKNDQIKQQSQVKLILEYDSNMTGLSHNFETRPWEKNLQKIYDETDPKKLIEFTDTHLKTYLALISEHVPRKTYEKEKAPLDYLNLAIYNCATALKYKNQDHELHFKLANLLEEKNFIEDIYGFKNEEEESIGGDFSLTSNKKAKDSSKEEEINAICKLRNVSETASVELKLKALDEEYHNLLNTGQQHKAEQVQLLYHFKVQQTKMDASGSSKVSDNQNPLGQAYLKYLDALHLSESAKITKYLYHFHVGRMYCIRSNFIQAVKHFTICLQWTSDEYQNLVRFYLGYSLSLDKTTSNTRYEEAVYYLCIGLQYFLSKINLEPETQKKLYAESLFSLKNVAFLQAFVNIGSLLKSRKPTNFTCISSKDSYHYCAWLSCIALNQIYAQTDSIKTLLKSSETLKQITWLLVNSHSNLLDLLGSSSTSSKTVSKQLIEKRCFYLSALLRNINKDNNNEILGLQLKICQRLVQLNPCDNYFLYLLGNAQLEKYDLETINGKEEFKNLLEECKNTLLASIELENKLAAGEPLPLITNQSWWIQLHEKKEEKPVDNTEKPAPVEDKPAAASGPSKPNNNAAVKPGAKQPPAKAAAPPPAPAKTPAKVVAAPSAPKKTTPATNAAKKPAGAEKGKECNHGNEPAKEAAVKVPTTTQPEVAKPASAKSTTSEKVPVEPPKTNKKIPSTRLILARVYSRLKDINNAKSFYNQVIDAEPNNHDAYIELADMLKANNDPMGAVDVYTRFKTDYSVLTFDDAYIFGEIVNTLMKNEKYDDPRLVKYTVLWAKVLGIGVLDKYIKKLDEKNKTKVCKEIYCGVHNKNIDDPELQNFFKFKGWI